MELNIIHNEDCLSGLRKLSDNSVDCCVTSPPYFNLRDYGVDGQIGLENTPEDYITRLVDVFREVRRVLKPEGTLWVNIADSYAGSGKGAWLGKMRENHPSSIPIIEIDEKGNSIRRFSSIKEAAIEYKLLRCSISLVCKGRLKTTGGKRFKFAPLAAR